MKRRVWRRLWPGDKFATSPTAHLWRTPCGPTLTAPPPPRPPPPPPPPPPPRYPRALNLGRALNWDLIAAVVDTQTRQECKKHHKMLEGNKVPPLPPAPPTPLPRLPPYPNTPPLAPHPLPPTHWPPTLPATHHASPPTPYPPYSPPSNSPPPVPIDPPPPHSLNDHTSHR